MSHRLPLVTAAALAAALTASVGAPPAAAAPTCVAVPVSTIGFTVGAAGQRVRVPAISDVSVCHDTAGSSGTLQPRVVMRTGCGDACFDVVVGGRRHDAKVYVSYYADGVAQRVEHDLAPITLGPASDICVFGIGSPANTACFTFLNVG